MWLLVSCLTAERRVLIQTDASNRVRRKAAAFLWRRLQPRVNGLRPLSISPLFHFSGTLRHKTMAAHVPVGYCVHMLFILLSGLALISGATLRHPRLEMIYFGKEKKLK